MASESIPMGGSGAPRGAAEPSAADPAFPPPVHDHSACTCRMMARAEDICRRDGLLLSPQRRRVLEALLSSHAPIGAYDLIERLAEKGPRPAPISVYRALAFLTENGLAHRIERLNAFVGCTGRHAEAGGPVAFLICDDCGRVAEVPAAGLGITLDRTEAATGFRPRSATIEITGRCADCRRAAETQAAEAAD